MQLLDPLLLKSSASAAKILLTSLRTMFPRDVTISLCWTFYQADSLLSC